MVVVLSPAGAFQQLEPIGDYAASSFAVSDSGDVAVSGFMPTTREWVLDMIGANGGRSEYRSGTPWGRLAYAGSTLVSFQTRSLVLVTAGKVSRVVAVVPNLGRADSVLGVTGSQVDIVDSLMHSVTRISIPDGASSTQILTSADISHADLMYAARNSRAANAGSKSRSLVISGTAAADDGVSGFIITGRPLTGGAPLLLMTSSGQMQTKLLSLPSSENLKAAGSEAGYMLPGMLGLNRNYAYVADSRGLAARYLR
ncbi:MAG: hypothetical protein ABI165_17540 [Bryobacteraceae bacterium]